MEAIQARLRQQEEENKGLAAERKRKLDELQQKVGGWWCVICWPSFCRYPPVQERARSAASWRLAASAPGL